MVFIKNENLTPLRWKLGRIIAVHPGKDEVTRVAAVKITIGDIRIMILKLCPLPIQNCNNN